tara:strand:+ start:590 stop:1039 length:450 start_codon:yes stop_codon:yes gene_type:complete
MNFAEERLADVLGEITPLLIDHWHHIALDKDRVPLAPAWDLYRDLDEQGSMKIITAREGGELVGYIVYLLSPSLHYTSQFFAEGDIFWLSPAHRKGSAGLRLFRFAETILKDAGVTKVINKVKLHADVGKVFEHMGYSPIERVYAKAIS